MDTIHVPDVVTFRVHRWAATALNNSRRWFRRDVAGGLVVFHEGALIHRTADSACADMDKRIDITDMRGYADVDRRLHLLPRVRVREGRPRGLARVLPRALPGRLGILMVPIFLSLPALDEDPTVTDVGEERA
jgi:hypothetical protein